MNSVYSIRDVPADLTLRRPMQFAWAGLGRRLPEHRADSVLPSPPPTV